MIGIELTRPAPAYTIETWSKVGALPNEAEFTIPFPNKVQYLCHVAGGNLKVRYEGKEYVISPRVTDL